jgi:hypothetical protein
VPAPRRSRTAATASRRLSRAPAANTWPNRSAPAPRGPGRSARACRAAASATSAARPAGAGPRPPPPAAPPAASTGRRTRRFGPGRPGTAAAGGAGVPPLQQHRRQPQRRDGPLHRAPLFGQLAKRGADEHPQALVRRPDDHLTPRPLVHQSPRVHPTAQVWNQPVRAGNPRAASVSVSDRWSTSRVGGACGREQSMTRDAAGARSVKLPHGTGPPRRAAGGDRLAADLAQRMTPGQTT